MYGVRFDPVISLGNIIAILCMLAPVLFIYFYVIRRMTSIETKIDIIWKTVTAERQRPIER